MDMKECQFSDKRKKVCDKFTKKYPITLHDMKYLSYVSQ